jgi:hypothetical protein
MLTNAYFSIIVIKVIQILKGGIIMIVRIFLNYGAVEVSKK